MERAAKTRLESLRGLALGLTLSLGFPAAGVCWIVWGLELLYRTPSPFYAAAQIAACILAALIGLLFWSSARARRDRGEEALAIPETTLNIFLLLLAFAGLPAGVYGLVVLPQVSKFPDSTAASGSVQALGLSALLLAAAIAAAVWAHKAKHRLRANANRLSEHP